MIERIIDWCASNRFLVFTGTAILTVWGIWAMTKTPLDAVPDISDVQVIVSTEWMGPKPRSDRGPDHLSDRLGADLHAAREKPFAASRTSASRTSTSSSRTAPTSTGRAAASSNTCRAFADSCRRASIPTIGPDATGVGWVFEYALVDETGQHSLAELRSLQDWHLRYWLASVPGVAEVASIGGFVKQYQVNLDPNKLAAYDVGVKQVVDAIKASNNDVEGRLLEFAGREYMVRGRGYLTSIGGHRKRLARRRRARHAGPRARRRAGPDRAGHPPRRRRARRQRRSVVGGIVVMRFGENALRVIDGVKAKLEEVQRSLPPGVRIVPTYDRSGLISESIGTLRRTLIEEAIVVSLVIIVFLFHFRSALIPIIALPIAVVASFIPMYYLGVTSNIMSLGGLALAIGVLVDASIVMVENAYRHVSGGADALRGTAAGDHRGREAGGAGDLLLAGDHRRVVRAGVPARSAGRADVPAAGLHEDVRDGRPRRSCSRSRSCRC